MVESFAVKLTIDFLIVAILISITYSDFKFRKIVLWQVISLLILFVISGLTSVSPINLLEITVTNLLIVFCQLLFVQLWFFARERRFKSIFDNKIGIGDFFFFGLLSIYFGSINLIIFLILSLSLIALITLVLKVFNYINQSIPLAGYWSSFITLLIICKYLFGVENYYEPLFQIS